MAGMKFTADVNVEDIIKLRQEIDKLKKSLIAVAGIPNSDVAIKQLEKEIAAATKKLEEYENKYLQIQKLKHDIDSSNAAVKKAKEETAALQSTNKWIVANTEAVIETDKQIKQLKKSFVSLADSEKTGSSGTGILRQVQQLAAQRLVEEESIRRTIKAQKDQIIQSRAEEGSITALRKQIILLTKDYDDLGRTRRNGDAGKALLAQIANVQKELSAAEQASGRFQRNVGNYASAWNGLSFSVQQVARELPSLAVNANTFFLAISNNLPILVDEIAKARKEYAAFKAEIAAGNKDVKAVAPVWQQLTKSLISWQTALVVGLTLLSVYGKDIINWGKSFFVAKKYISDTYQTLESFRNKVSEVSSTTLSTLIRLSDSWKRLGGDINAQKKFILDNKDAIDSMGVSVTNASEAERIFNTNKDAFILGIMQRAKAAATMDLAAEEYKKAVQKMMEVESEKEKGPSWIDRTISTLVNIPLSILPGSQKTTKEDIFQTGINDLNKEADELIKSGTKLIQKYADFSEEERKILESIGIKTTQTMVAGSVEAIEASIALKQQALKKVTNTADYKRIEAEIKVEKEKLRAITGETTKEYNSIIDQQKKISELLDKQALERRRRAEDHENQLIQSRIDAMAEGEAKIRAQRELDNKKEIQDLERQREDYIRTEIELQRKAFDEQENLRAKQTKDYKKRTFDPSTVKVDTAAFDKILNNIILRQDIYPYQEEMKYWNEYLKEYGTFQQKKAAINEEYNLKISEATTKGAKKSLEKEKENKLKEVSFEELKSSINFANIFGNLDDQSTEALVRMRDNLKEVINKAAKDIKPTDLKALQDAFKEIDLKITVRNPLGELKNSADNYRNATSAVIKAQEDLNTVIQGGEVITKVYTDENGKLTTRLLTLTQAENNLAAAQSDRQKALSKLTQAANSIGQKGMEVVNAGNDVVGMLENFGVKVPEAISKTLDGIGQVMSGLERIDLTKPFSAITGAVSVLAGVGNTIAGLFGFGGADYSRYNEMVDEYNKLNEIWDELIDKKKEYIDMSYGPEAAKAGDEAIEIANKSIESYKILGRERLQSGASAGSHSIGVRIRNSMSQELWDQWDEFAKSIGKDPDFIGGRLSGLFDLTAEQLEKLKEEAPGFWSKLDGDVQNYLNKIIEGGERIEDIQKAVQEQLTQTSFDSLFDSFIDTLMDMDASSKDFADNFGEYMRKAVFTQMFVKGYEDELRKWYESFSAAMGKEGGITSSDIKDLREGWDTIVNGALEDRKAWEQIVGGGTSTSQESSKKGFATMSQDSADELNGRFTALQIAGEEIKNQNQLQTMSILDLKAGMLSIGANTSGIKDIAGETRDLIRLSYEAITDIRDNTNVMVKPIQQMAADIAEVKRNTNGLSKK
ncbi:hypothetical protein KGH27_14980 [Bacteroides faecis]|uniref:hypothetical protein n=1 Tax=Bacteroides faecis TaxID=674529 RepID=UPI001E32CF56|nr:hypothetical protein [Bacteroides faecis]MCC2068772.1 hypothetical protein [Bacteroides faecis]